MWHEARKQERKIRGMIVDYRKRAERRQDFYEKIKADPTQFMQVHGRRCTIHLDHVNTSAGDGSTIIVPWQGQSDNLIDRFDIRAHLDAIPTTPKTLESSSVDSEERHCNYERYRILAQNDFLGISEEKFLSQLHLDEQFGASAHCEPEKFLTRRKATEYGAAINYFYSDSNFSNSFGSTQTAPSANISVDSLEAYDSDLDMDVSIDVCKIDTTQAHELNACGRNYGMMSNDFYSFLTKDADEVDALKMAREEEQEKLLLGGRKSRRERRAQRDKRMPGRPISPPSYAAKDDVGHFSCNMENDSDSRSSPENFGKITFITSFGGEDDMTTHSKSERRYSVNGKRADRQFRSGCKHNQSRYKIAQSTSRSRSRSKESIEKIFEEQHSMRSYNVYSTNKNSRIADFRSRPSRICQRQNFSPSRYTTKTCKEVSKIQGDNSGSNSVCSKFPPFLREDNPDPDSPSFEQVESKELIATGLDVVPVKRYYGRRRDGFSSDELSDLEDQYANNFQELKFNETSENAKSTFITGANIGKTSSSEVPSSSPRYKVGNTSKNPNLRDRLKRKMQVLLNKQYKADKRAETERNERQMQQQQAREDEMRELALKLRKRQRELRHKCGTPTDESSDSSESVSTGVRFYGNDNCSARPYSRSESRDKESNANSNRYQSSLKYIPRLQRDQSRSRYHECRRNDQKHEPTNKEREPVYCESGANHSQNSYRKTREKPSDRKFGSFKSRLVDY